jgi:hypothetical protein
MFMVDRPSLREPGFASNVESNTNGISTNHRPKSLFIIAMNAKLRLRIALTLCQATNQATDQATKQQTQKPTPTPKHCQTLPRQHPRPIISAQP